MAAVLAFYKNPVELPRRLAAPLTELGLMTYGVYLLHPVVWQTLWPLCQRAGAPFLPAGAIATAVLLTLAAAWASYRWYELPMMRLGKRLTSAPRRAGITVAAAGGGPGGTAAMQVFASPDRSAKEGPP